MKVFIESILQLVRANIELLKTIRSKSKGGSLGEFEPGQMVLEFDDVVFENDPKKASEIGAVVGPVKTQFGYHLIRVDKRFENQQKTDGTGAF